MAKDMYDEILMEEQRMARERERREDWEKTLNEDSEDLLNAPIFVSNKKSGSNELPKPEAIIFVIMFIGMLIFFTMEQIALGFACLGAIFFAVGFSLIRTGQISWDLWGMIFLPIGGFLMFFISVMEFISDKTKAEFAAYDAVKGFLMKNGFLMIGVIIMVMTIVKVIVKRRKCTEKLIARCVYLEECINRDSDGHISVTYAPRWEYGYDGNIYHYQDTVSSNHPPRIGSERAVYIDPTDPRRMYKTELTSIVIPLAIGAFLVMENIVAAYPEIFG